MEAEAPPTALSASTRGLSCWIGWFGWWSAPNVKCTPQRERRCLGVSDDTMDVTWVFAIKV